MQFPMTLTEVLAMSIGCSAAKITATAIGPKPDGMKSSDVTPHRQNFRTFRCLSSGRVRSKARKSNPTRGVRYQRRETVLLDKSGNCLLAANYDRAEAFKNGFAELLGYS
jgi:hypothetical protein